MTCVVMPQCDQRVGHPIPNIKQIPIALQIKTGLTIGIGIGCPTVCDVLKLCDTIQ